MKSLIETKTLVAIAAFSIAGALALSPLAASASAPPDQGAVQPNAACQVEEGP